MVSEPSTADTLANTYQRHIGARRSEHRASESPFELSEDRGGSWRRRLHNRNGNVLTSGGEGDASRSCAWDAVESVTRSAPEAGFVETDE
jgi:uncharacterized protein YegP (UPF0339 family)